MRRTPADRRVELARAIDLVLSTLRQQECELTVPQRKDLARTLETAAKGYFAYTQPCAKSRRTIHLPSDLLRPLSA